jgi:hypothetical protein
MDEPDDGSALEQQPGETLLEYVARVKGLDPEALRREQRREHASVLVELTRPRRAAAAASHEKEMNGEADTEGAGTMPEGTAG